MSDPVRLQVTREERDRGALAPTRHAAAAQALADDGFVVLDDLVPVELLDRLRDRMHRDLEELQRRAVVNPRRWVGHLQHQPPFEPEHLFPDVVANRVVASVAQALLGDEMRIVLYTANTNLPGSVRQAVHNDINQLWSDVVPAPPAHLLVCNLPLVDTSTANAVELWPGTHRDPRTHAEGRHVVVSPDEWLEEWRRSTPPIQVPQRRGSVLLRDARLWHAGVPNTSGEVRVMLAVAYAPPWYAAEPLTFPTRAASVVEQLPVPVLARFTDEPFDQLDAAYSGLAGPQMRRQGRTPDAD